MVVMKTAMEQVNMCGFCFRQLISVGPMHTSFLATIHHLCRTSSMNIGSYVFALKVIAAL